MSELLQNHNPNLYLAVMDGVDRGVRMIPIIGWRLLGSGPRLPITVELHSVINNRSVVFDKEFAQWHSVMTDAWGNRYQSLLEHLRQDAE